MIYMHARWKKSRSSEDIDKLYLQWTPRDRVALTFFHF